MHKHVRIDVTLCVRQFRGKVSSTTSVDRVKLWLLT